MYLIVLLNVIIHGCLMGSRVVLSLFAIELGVNALSIGLMVALYSATPLLLGAEPVGDKPDEFAAFVRLEIQKYAKVIKASGAKVD